MPAGSGRDRYPRGARAAGRAGRRGRTRWCGCAAAGASPPPPSGPPTTCCTPPASPPSRCAPGSTDAAAAKAVRHLRTLVGAAGLALADGDAVPRPRRRAASHHKDQLTAAAAQGRGRRPVDRARRTGDCPATGSTARCAARWWPRWPAPDGAGARPALVAVADDQPAPGPGAGHAGDGPLGRRPARPRRAGLVPGAAGPGRGAGAARPDQPALHLQRADRDRLVRAHRPGAGPRADPGVRRVHPVLVPGARRLHHARRGAALDRPVPDHRAGPVRRPAPGAAADRARGAAGRPAVPVPAAAGGERRPARPVPQARAWVW